MSSFIFKLVGHLRLGKIIKKNCKFVLGVNTCSFTRYIECFAIATDNVLSHGSKRQPYVSWCRGDGTGVLFVENLDR